MIDDASCDDARGNRSNALRHAVRDGTILGDWSVFFF